MLRVCSIFLILVGLATTSQARTESMSTKDMLRTNLLNYFTPYLNIPKDDQKTIQDQLINTTSDSKLFYPPFPRTWIERASGEPHDTTTTAIFDTSKLLSAVNTFAGPLSTPIKAVFNGVQLGYSYEKSIKYSYNRQTTLMVMTSWRQLQDPANPKAVTPKSILENSVIRQTPNLYNYFKVSKEYPLLGMCKYEMSLAIIKTATKTFSFALGSQAKGDTLFDSMSYTVYSNFFQIEDNVTVEDYLQVRCGENFTEAVRFLVESEFKKMVTGIFAHYHPKAECRWDLPSANTPKNGDQDCLGWFNKLNILGLDKSTTVPRCILGNEGFPVCAIRTAKTGTYCPLYAAKGKLSTSEPEAWDRQLNPMDNQGSLNGKTLYVCDHGFECRLDNGKPVAAIPLSMDRIERLRHLLNANYITTCQPKINRSGK